MLRELWSRFSLKISIKFGGRNFTVQINEKCITLEAQYHRGRDQKDPICVFGILYTSNKPAISYRAFFFNQQLHENSYLSSKQLYKKGLSYTLTKRWLTIGRKTLVLIIKRSITLFISLSRPIEAKNARKSWGCSLIVFH